MLNADELFERLFAESNGSPTWVWGWNEVGGFSAAPLIDILKADGRLESRGIGSWRLTLHAIAIRGFFAPEDEERFIRDLNEILPPNQGTFRIKDIVSKKGWTYPDAVAIALSLARQDRLEHKFNWHDQFRLLEPI